MDPHSRAVARGEMVSRVNEKDMVVEAGKGAT